MNVVKDCTVVQEIFNKVIEAGYYGDTEEEGVPNSLFMCFALESAVEDQVISSNDFGRGLLAIEAYLAKGGGKHHALASLLSQFDLPCSERDCLAVYKDWDNRPDLRART